MVRTVAPGGQEAPESPQGLWEAQRLENYRYTLQVSCFCLTEMTRSEVIEVRNGKEAIITYADDSVAIHSISELSSVNLL